MSSNKKTKSVNLESLINATKKLDEKLGLQNNMTASVHFEDVMGIVAKYPNGVSPQQIAIELSELLGMAVTDKQIRKMFQTMGLSKNKSQAIVQDFGSYAWQVQLVKNGNRSLYKNEKFNLSK